VNPRLPEDVSSDGVERRVVRARWIALWWVGVLLPACGSGEDQGREATGPTSPPAAPAAAHEEEVPPEAADWGPREWVDATESLREGRSWSHHYRSVRVPCPLCETEFLAARLGSHSTLAPDLDFKPNGLSADPLLFALWMCPTCGYSAFQEDFAHPVTPEIRRALAGARRYESYFDIPYSALLRAAEACYGARSYPEWQWAWLYLYGAWVARDSARPVEERAYHEAAMRRFEALAGTETGEKRAEAAYVVAEIRRRHGLPDASAWLDRAEEMAREADAEHLPSWIEACRKALEKGTPDRPR
jgi:hypothetical protein